MAAGDMLVREVVALGVKISVISMEDRRNHVSDEPVEWAFQRDIEASLYRNGFSSQSGAVYRLLQRSGVGARALPLKKASISDGVITQDEYDWIYHHLGGGVRSFTLIPLDALRTAIEKFGRDERSEALIGALGMERPPSWESEEEGEEEGEEDGEEEASGGEGEEGEDGEDDSEGDNGNESGSEDDAPDGVSVASTEVAEQPAISDDDSEDGAQDAEAPGSTSAASRQSGAAKRQHVSTLEVSPALDAELDAFDAHRAAVLNHGRRGIAVAPETRKSDRKRVLRFLAWLSARYKFKAPPSLNVFAHSQIGTVSQRYIKELVDTQGCKYSYAAKMAASLVAAASFVSFRRDESQENSVVLELRSLHLQCSQQARKQDKFDLGKKPVSWMEWEDVQRVRVAAEKAFSSAKSDAQKRMLTRDITVLRLLADQPPDRVGVIRALKLGFTLKRKADGAYELDISEPGAHKTSSVFGATRTTINASITPWLNRYIQIAAIPHGGFLFHTRNNKMEVVTPSAWTERVKAIFKRHGDVPLCPKDSRSSFITFLRSGDHDDETIKAAAVAMRHSSKTQASAAYDKGSSDKRVSAAMKVAADYSSKFKASSGASSSSSKP